MLGDARCGVDLDDPAFKGAGAVIDLLRDRAFTASGLSGFTSGWFTFGTIEWSSGCERRDVAPEVLGHDVTGRHRDPGPARGAGSVPSPRVTPSPSAPAATSASETCGTKFANTANFRGFPHIPGQDAVLRYATKDGGHEGSVL